MATIPIAVVRCLLPFERVVAAAWLADCAKKLFATVTRTRTTGRQIEVTFFRAAG